MMPIRKNYDQNWLPSFFNDFFENDWMPRMNATAPAINVMEDEHAYKIEVAAPGMTKDDFKISLSGDDMLTISLEKNDSKEEKDENEKKYLRREFSYSKFQQSMSLPEDVDKEQINASVKDGVLSITLNKKEMQIENNEPRMIEIS